MLKPNKQKIIHFLALTVFVFGIGCQQGYRIRPGDATKKVQGHEEIEVTRRYGKSLRGRVNSIPVLVLRGSYEELGEAHGVLAGKDIIRLLDSLLIPFANRGQKNVWDTKILPASQSFVIPDDYEKELKGIFNGIKTIYPEKHDRILKSLNREVNIEDLRALNSFGDIFLSMGGCSSFSVWGSLTANGDVICGRNLDERYIPGKPPFMIMAREPSDLNRQSSIDINGPGMIGVSTAMNADGLTFILHDSGGINADERIEWVPRGIVLREAIELSRVVDSAEKIGSNFSGRAVRISSNIHVTLSRNEFAKSPSPFVVEWDGRAKENGITVREGDSSVLKDGIVCTNHFVNRRTEGVSASKSSRMRYALLLKLIQEYHSSKRKINVGNAIRILDSVGENGDIVTYLSVVAIPKERKMIFAVSPGNGLSATKREWIEITWDQIFRVL